MDTKEKQLIDGLRAGDQDAVRNWYTQYNQRLLAFVMRKIDLVPDAEEVVQEVFMNSLRQIQLFRGGSSLWTWMCGIARHEIADFYRKKYAKKALKHIPLLDSLIVEADGLSWDESDLVKSVLAQMGEYSGKLLHLKYIERYTVAELACLYEKTTKAIESDLYRARKEFKVVYAHQQVAS